MREASSESTTTIVPTEYGPLVLSRTVVFGREDVDIVIPRRRNQGAEQDASRLPKRP